MSLSTLVIPVLMPPVSLAVLAVIAWFFRRSNLGGALTVICLAALCLLATPLAADWLLYSLERDIHPAAGAAGAIVVLGGDATDGSAEPGGAPGSVGPLTLERLRAAAILARRTGLPMLVTGGVVETDLPPVARLMQRSLQTDFAVSPRWVEAASADTWQNAQYSAAILRAQGISRVLLVTHEWHERRARIAFAAAGIDTIAAPVQWDRPPKLRATDLLPHATGWVRSYYALHEWIGCVWYGLRAWTHRRPV